MEISVCVVFKCLCVCMTSCEYHRWWHDPVSALNLQPFDTLLPTSTCAEAVNAMKESNLSEIPVIKEK